MALLLGSIGGNVWQYEKAIRIRIPERDFRHVTYKDPILGLSGEEVATIVQGVVSQTGDASEHRILSIEKKGHDNVLVYTGSIHGALAGHGHIYRFRRINGEWVLDRGIPQGWIS